MKRKILSCFALVLASSTALAGLRYDSPVQTVLYGDGSGYARGALGTAANSANNLEYIGCMVRNYGSGNETWCHARDAAGESLTCRTTSEYVARAVAAINSDSHVYFFALASGTCSQLEVSTNSQHYAKQS